MAELDREYICRMEDILAVYEKPLSKEEPVVCIDEKPIVLHQDTRAPLPACCGHAARRDYEYRRRGTANVFCGVEPKAGRHFTKTTATRASTEFAGYLAGIAAQYPSARTIHLVMDNLSSHKRKALVDCFGEKDGDALWNRFTAHYTPKHGSWLNQAEIEIGVFARQCLGKRRIATLTALRRETRAWNDRMNHNKTIINWRFTRKKARSKMHYKVVRSRY